MMDVQNNQSTFLMAACLLMKQFSSNCGAKSPDRLRGTTLRKHLATKSSLMNLGESDVTDLANFLGHAEKNHREHYRLPVLTREISKMSQLLEKAQGSGDLNANCNTLRVLNNKDEEHLLDVEGTFDSGGS